MADSSAIDQALVDVLQDDGALALLLPDGVYVDEAPPNVTRFVIVSLVVGMDVATYGRGRAFEDVLYIVKAVVLSTSGGNIRAAAARLDALLDGGTLVVPGYVFGSMHREERLRMTEVDDVDNSIRWQHRGGRYRVHVAPV